MVLEKKSKNHWMAHTNIKKASNSLAYSMETSIKAHKSHFDHHCCQPSQTQLFSSGTETRNCSEEVHMYTGVHPNFKTCKCRSLTIHSLGENTTQPHSHIHQVEQSRFSPSRCYLCYLFDCLVRTAEGAGAAPRAAHLHAPLLAGRPMLALPWVV